jgi:SlyX protein
MSEADRLEALETKSAYVEAAVQELSDVIYRQQQVIDRLLLGQHQLLQRLAQLEPGEATPPEVAEKPPHY